jgi:hypothetical protein
MKADGGKGLEGESGVADGVVVENNGEGGEVGDSGKRMGMAGGCKNIGRLQKQKELFMKLNTTRDVDTIRR